MKKAFNAIKGIYDSFKDYIKLLPIWGRVLFVVIFLLLDIIIPVAILTPITLKVTERHKEMLEKAKEHVD
jgi:hypothetical protein